MPIFAIAALALLVLKIGGVAGFASISWWLIAALFALPAVIIGGFLLLFLVAAVMGANVCSYKHTVFRQ